jgi:hypothetical protein
MKRTTSGILFTGNLDHGTLGNTIVWFDLSLERLAHILISKESEGISPLHLKLVCIRRCNIFMPRRQQGWG